MYLQCSSLHSLHEKVQFSIHSSIMEQFCTYIVSEREMKLSAAASNFDIISYTLGLDPIFLPQASFYSGANWKVYKYCFMRQKCQIQMGLAQYRNVATPLSIKSIDSRYQHFQMRYVTLFQLNWLKSYQLKQKCNV